jgi:nucleoside-diphosphate-sugar epimerase
MHLFDKVMLRAREMVEKGVIGSLCGIESYYGFDLGTTPGGRYFSQAYTHWAYKLPGGLFQNGLDHPLSMVLPFLPRPKTVMAMAGEAGVLPKGIPSELRILLGDGRLLASITLSEAASPRFHYLNLLGSKGTLQVDLQNKRVIHYSHRKGIPHFVTRAFMNVNQGARILAGTVATVGTVLRGRFTPYEGMQRLVPDFYKAIEKDTPSPIPPEWALTVMRTMDSVWDQIGSEKREVKGGAVVPLATLSEVGVARETGADLPGEEAKTVLVTGGTGFIGSQLAKALLKQGTHKVRLMVRNLEKATALRALGAEIVVGNLLDEKTIRSAVEGVDCIYHLAATMGGKKSDYLEGTVKGTARLIRAAKAQGVERIVLASSIAVYGIPSLGRGQKVGENAPYAERELTSYIESKIDAERVLLREAEGGDLSVTILRLGVVYGPGKGISRIGYPLLGRFFIKVGMNDITLPSVYLDNAVQACLLAGASEAGGHQTYNVVDDVRFTQLGYLRARREFQPTRWLRFPYFLFQMMGAVARTMPGGLMRRVASYLTPFHLKSCVAQISYDNSKIKRELDWSPDADLAAHLRTSFDGGSGEAKDKKAAPVLVEPARRSA